MVFEALDLLFHSSTTGTLYLSSFRSYKGMNNISTFAFCEKIKVVFSNVESCLKFCLFCLIFRSQCSLLGTFYSRIKGQSLNCKNVNLRRLELQSTTGIVIGRFKKNHEICLEGYQSRMPKKPVLISMRLMQVVIAAYRGRTK